MRTNFSTYYLNRSSGSDPALKYQGADVTAGEFGGWMPIGAVTDGNGYDVAWKNTSTNQYTVWTTDSNGNYTGNLIGAVSGNSYALKSLEPVFQQDLNGDGVSDYDEGDPDGRIDQPDRGCEPILS